jgi:sugar phosphate isomerase/epimerase
MSLQGFEVANQVIKERYLAAKRADPGRFERSIDLSWSNWVFGRENLDVTFARLKANGVDYVELHGNHHGPDLGYKAGDLRSLLAVHGLSVSGTCGIFGPANDLSSAQPECRQAALDYLRREINFLDAVGGSYLIVVPGAVGRVEAQDEAEFSRSAETLAIAAEQFIQSGVRCAIEPIRSAEVSLVHTVDDAQRYIEAVASPGVDCINGDIFHMLSEETHVGAAILAAGERLVNLHLADSNRRALGLGQMDIDTVIMAAYLAGLNRPGRFATPEPLGPGGSPYGAMHGLHAPEDNDALVAQTISCWRERETTVRATT